jgi:hypothetical protein
MAVQYPEKSYAFVNSKSTSVPNDLLHTASSGMLSSIYSVAGLISVKKNFLLLYPRKAVVLQSFFINVQPIEDGFVATSNLSDVYELGETSSQAVHNYLCSLVDELIWFHEHKQSLSLPMLNDLGKLQLYLRLV